MKPIVKMSHMGPAFNWRWLSNQFMTYGYYVKEENNKLYCEQGSAIITKVLKTYRVKRDKTIL